MNTTHVQSKFEKLGVRAKIRPLQPRRSWQAPPGPVVIDIGTDRQGEFFDIQSDGQVDIEVIDCQPRDRHLLLLVRRSAERVGLPELKDKFLCGHDERHWFVAGVPEAASVSSVITAKEALKPDAVRNLEQGTKGKRAKRHRRKTETFVRQGEWFFLPSPATNPPLTLILPNEPLRRGGGKPHMCQELYRTGGTTVHVCREYPNGLTESEYKILVQRKPHIANKRWSLMRRDPSVFVRGRVSHADHATITLDGWHRVVMNTENQSRAVAFMAFLD